MDIYGPLLKPHVDSFFELNFSLGWQLLTAWAIIHEGLRSSFFSHGSRDKIQIYSTSRQSTGTGSLVTWY